MICPLLESLFYAASTRRETHEDNRVGYTSWTCRECPVPWVKRQYVFHRSSRMLTSGFLSSVQFSHSVVSSSLWPHGLQHTRPPCSSPIPGVYSNSSHWVGDAIQTSHPLSFPSPSAFNLSQYQGLFQWVSSSHHVAKALEYQLQHQSFQWIFRTDFLWDELVGSPCRPRDSQESSPTSSSKASIL